MRLSLFAAAALACATTLAAHADTLQQFYASNINFDVGPNTPATTG